MKKDNKKDTISTFIGPDVSIEGVIKFQGTIRLDGKIRGKIHTDAGMVVVGEKAVINADISVDSAIIMGEVNGTINAREKIEAHPPGRVLGDIRAPIISIDSGVVFNGSCSAGARTILSKDTSDPIKKTGDALPGSL